LLSYDVLVVSKGADLLAQLEIRLRLAILLSLLPPRRKGFCAQPTDSRN